MATDAPRAPDWKQMRRRRALELKRGGVRTYAPCGVTPVLRPFVTRTHLSVMSGVTPQGQFYTLTRRRSLQSFFAGAGLDI